MKRLPMFSAALLPLAAMAPAMALAQEPMAAPTTTVAQPFLMMAAEGDIFEITTSQIALMRSQNPGIRAFSTMLIDHHTNTTNTALVQAKAAGIAPPPAILQQEKRDQITQLLEASAADFDRVFLTQQVPSHEQALALHTTYSRRGDTPQLQAASKAALPFVKQHLASARKMLKAM